MTDIATIKTTDRTIEILHPATREPIGIRVTLMSIDDERMTKIKRKITDRRLYLEQRGKTFKAEEIEENKTEILFGAMTGWDWYAPEGGEQPTFHGKTPEFNRRDVSAVLTELTWFADQVNEAVGETQAFFTTFKPN